MDIRPYLPADYEPCLAVLDSLAPYEMSAQRDLFATFLKAPQSPYFVIHHASEIAGCGGFALSATNASARLLWGMVRSDLQRQGLGRLLLMFRLREIGKLSRSERVHVDVSPEVAPFYEKQGFRSLGVSGNRIELVKRLAVCT